MKMGEVVMNSKKHTSTSLGITSLITFFTILILVSFSLLVTTTARNDSQLSIRAADSVTEYYAADYLAEEKLMQLHNLVLQTPNENLIKVLEDNGYTVSQPSSSNEILVEYSVVVNDKKDLLVEIMIDLNHVGSLNRVSWQTVII